MFQIMDSDKPFDPTDGLLVPYAMRSTFSDRRRKARRLRLVKLLGPVITVAILIATFFALRAALSTVSLGEVMSALAGVPAGNVLASLGLVALSYFFLTGYDVLGLHYLGRRLPYPQIALGSFASYAFANNLGFALLTGGSVRYRIYAPAGVTTSDVAILTTMCGLTFALSATLVVALCLVLQPVLLSGIIGLPPVINLLLGLALLGGLGRYLWWVWQGSRALTWGNWRLPLPGFGSTIGQFAVGAGDLACAAGALYLLLPADPGISYWVFVGVFATAMTLGLISHVPGGVGVFEGIILLTVPGATSGEVLASLLVFRILYYLLPLGAGLALMVWHETRDMPDARSWRKLLKRLLRPMESRA